ncbi:hypothetical protein OG824_13030 [Streptomyces prunicolor]|uniref:hypothetical protein n=1 Tax=Streptomyces prunicolor TaxID=67348 RepID=UPI002256BF42|nr:hypothetical protein [Streptomyces prunicolor]MCX5236125.1 hypothetical protein [Streptomyces prunicolor]
MRSYMNSGNCPRCRQQILNFAYSLVNGELSLAAYATGLTFTQRLRLAPGGAPVTFTPPNTFTCLFCRENWEIRDEGRRDLSGGLHLGTTTSPLFSTSVDAATPFTSRALSPAQFSFAGIAPKRSSEVVVVRKESKVMRNNSSATLTRREDFSWARERTVTIEERKATIKGTKGELTLAGLAALGGTLTDEVRSMYAVTSQEKLMRTTSVSAELPPYSAIEIYLEWTLVRELGVGRFTESEGARVEMPFAVDIDLSVEWHSRDAHD